MALTCPECQASNSDSARYCARCGGPLVSTSERAATCVDSSGRGTAPRAAGCSSCGAAMQPFMAFCPRCGQSQTAVDTGPGTRAASDPSPGPTVTESLGRGLNVGDVIWGDYRLEARLGQGGMGTVFRARNIVESQEVVAIKLLDPGEAADEGAVARLRREAIAARGLQHPGIVQVYEFRAEGDHVGLVMELLEGSTLMQHLGGEVLSSPFLHGDLASRLDRITSVAEQVAGALDYIHGKDLVHRDVKPSNVMVVSDGTDGGPVRVKLLDFGVVHAVQGVAMTGMEQPGTVLYMAPELLHGEGTPSPAADIYSFGRVLYELLTGRLPAGIPTPPSEAVPGLPAGLDEAVLDCLREPHERPASTSAVAAAIRAAQREPVAPASPPAPVAQPALPPTPTPVAQPATVPAAPQRLDERRRSPWPLLLVGVGGVGLLFAVILAVVVGKFMAAGGDSGAEPTHASSPAVVSAPTDTGTVEKTAVPAAAQTTPAPIAVADTRATETEVEARYDDWVRAWESRDIGRYMAFYARDVEIKRANKPSYLYADLRTRMGANFNKQAYIRIDDGEPRLTVEGDQVHVEVWHDYDSETWWDNGTKRMTWRNDGGTWMVVAESFEQADGGSKR